MVEAKLPVIKAFEAHYANMSSMHHMSKLMFWLSFLHLTATYAPQVFETAYEEHFGPSSPMEGPAWAEQSQVLLDVEEYLRTIHEFAYGHIVDRFLYYLVMIVECVYEVDPALIPDSKIRMSEVVACGSIEEMLKQRARLAAADLSFSSPKLISTALAVAGVSKDAAAEAQSSLGQAVAIRNLLVHHSGIVNERFVREYPQHADLLGKAFPVDGYAIETLTGLVHDLRKTIDSAMQVRYGISVAGLLKVANEYWDQVGASNVGDG